jgi:hypothetical protein
VENGSYRLNKEWFLFFFFWILLLQYELQSTQKLAEISNQSLNEKK